MPKLEMNEVVEVIISASKRQLDITQANFQLRKGTRQNFNLFLGIVNGKHPKDHIEKYHSNFIAYLLDPESTHDCEDFFLLKFIEIVSHLKKDIKFDGFIPSKVDLESISLEREKPINGGDGLIDIVIESTDWIIFIENKINSPEGKGQIDFYCNWASNTGKKWLGIYLTKFGFPLDTTSNNLVFLSYSHIIDWLQQCQLSIELINFPHIQSAILQYISVLKNITKIMNNEDQIQMNKYFNEDIEKAMLLTENILIPKISLETALKVFIKEERNDFIAELKKELIRRLENEGFNPDNELMCTINKKRFFIAVQQNPYYPNRDETGGLGMWWGIYQAKDQPFKQFNELGIDPNYKYWKSVNLVNKEGNSLIVDYWDDVDKGSLLLLQSKKDPVYRTILINHILEQDIIPKILASKEVILKLLRD